MIVASVALAACGSGGGGSDSPNITERESITGHVFDGAIEAAVVCLDANGSGRCDSGEPQAATAADGSYTLSIPKGSTAPLLAEVIAGQSRDADRPGVFVDASYRMGSPSRAYGTEITPYSTLVMLTGQSDGPLAEDIVRDVVGLPPRASLVLDASTPTASLPKTVAAQVVVALKAKGLGFALSGPTAMAELVAAFPTPLTALPQLRIATKGGAPIVSREEYVDATYVLTNPAAAVTERTLAGKIRGRGHSTWGQPKNPYKVQFANDAAYAAIGDVLGMKKQRNWALLADYFDRSLIRNKLALSLGSSSVFRDGLKWTPSGQHVEVWLNGDYAGVYLLTEDVRIDPARLDLHKMSSDAAANDVEGGYIAEVDQHLDCFNDGTLNLQLVTPNGITICIDTPDEDAITPAQLAYVKNLLLQAESDIYDAKKLDRLNTVSFADWYLVQELFRNNDATFVSSDWLWKDAPTATNPLDRLINMGPLWDFDRGAGNVNTWDNWRVEGCWVGKYNPGNWLAVMLDHPDFRALVLARWKAKRARLAAFIDAGIDTYDRRLGDAAQRNFARWPIFDVPLTNYYTFANHAEEVAFLRSYLAQRMAWLDKAFADTNAFETMCR